MKNNKAVIPFIIAAIIALGIIVTTTYDSSTPRVESQVATTEISTTVSPATVPAQKQTNYSSTSSSTTTTTTTTQPGPKPDAEVIFDFGNWEANPGDDVKVWVTLTANGNAIAAMDVVFKQDSPIEIKDIGKQATCLNKATISTNVALPGLNFTCTNQEGDAIVAEDGGRVFLLTYHVPDTCPDGEYKIGFADKCEVFKDNQSNKYSTASINGIIKVGNGGSQTTTTSSSTTTTTTTTSSSSSTTTTTTPGPNPPSGEYTPAWGDVNCDGKVNVSDVVLLNKWLNDNKAYNMTDQGKVNADCCDPQDPTGGKVKVSGVKLTAADSDAIIRSIVHLVTLPVVNG